MATHQRINKQQQQPAVGPRVGQAKVRSPGLQPTSAVTAPPSLGSALQRAETFGHCLHGVTPQAPIQQAIQPIGIWHLQRQLVEEEQKRDEDAESAQRKVAPSSGQAAPPVQFFVGKIVAKMAGKFLGRHFPGRGG